MPAWLQFVRPMPRHPELEAALQHAPDDPLPRQVYADWLVEQGDAFGQLLTLELADEPSTEATRQQLRANELGQALARFRHGLAVGAFEFEWSGGFVRTLHLRRQPLSSRDVSAPGLLALLDDLLPARCFVCLRKLVIVLGRWDATVPEVVARLRALRKPELLEELNLGPARSGENTTELLRDVFPRLAKAASLHRPDRGAGLELVSLGGAPCPTMRDGDVFPLAPTGPTTLGRDSAADIVVQHEGINRRNFGIHRKNGQWLFSHFGGTNSIELNGVPTYAHDVPLAEGDLISPVPGVVLRFHT